VARRVIRTRVVWRGTRGNSRYRLSRQKSNETRRLTSAKRRLHKTRVRERNGASDGRRDKTERRWTKHAASSRRRRRHGTRSTRAANGVYINMNFDIAEIPSRNSSAADIPLV